jgi:crotonobetainyl-CoA:carnitine CoA-transferase CaiB-like acyl-CoA transferase
VPERHRTGSTRVVPFQAFETRTGPIVVAAGNDRLFARLAAVLNHPEWASDPRFASNAARVTNRAALVPEIERVLLTRSKGEWVDRLEAAGVPCAPINTLPEAVTESQAAALGMIQPVPGDGLELVALPLSFDGVRPGIRRGPPRPGEHTEELRGRAPG